MRILMKLLVYSEIFTYALILFRLEAVPLETIFVLWPVSGTHTCVGQSLGAAGHETIQVCGHGIKEMANSYILSS